MLLKLLFPCLLFLQGATAGAQAKIAVQVSNFRNNNGVCIVCLYDNANAFQGKGLPLRTVRVAVSDKTALAVFEDVPAGNYAVSVVHDANNNNRFDTNLLGIPIEGYGASKNKLPFAAAPKFEENMFAVDTALKTAVFIKLRYLL
jgi:uncharacterized protein (DUF2141 family)